MDWVAQRLLERVSGWGVPKGRGGGNARGGRLDSLGLAENRTKIATPLYFFVDPYSCLPDPGKNGVGWRFARRADSRSRGDARRRVRLPSSPMVGSSRRSSSGPEHDVSAVALDGVGQGLS